MNALIAAILLCTAQTGNECGFAVYSDGRPSVVIEGESDRIRWGWAITAATVSDTRIELYHTHPAGTPLSIHDMNMIYLPAVMRVCAVMPSGAMDCVERE